MINNNLIHKNYNKQNLNDKPNDNNYDSELNYYNRAGIINNGNTCYMNSIVQIIYNVPILVKYVFEIDINDDSSENINLIKDLRSIFSLLNNNYRYISITNIFKNFYFDNNNYNSAQDATEYYNQILDIIGNFNKKIKTLTNGTLITKIEVKEKNYLSEVKEDFLLLGLEMDKCHSLSECLEKFFQKEKMTGENKIEFIENNKKIYYEGTKQYFLKKIPSIIHINLKRFKYNFIKKTFRKLNNKIQFSEVLDFSSYIEGEKTCIYNKKYFLYAILIHSGSFNNGHYYVIVKDFFTNKYIKINDTELICVSKYTVLNQFCGGYYYFKDFDNKYRMEKEANVYVLIYINASKIKYFFDYKYVNKLLGPKKLYANKTSNYINPKTNINNNHSYETKRETFQNINKDIDNKNTFLIKDQNINNTLKVANNVLNVKKIIRKPDYDNSFYKKSIDKNVFKSVIIDDKVVDFNTLLNIKIDHLKEENSKYTRSIDLSNKSQLNKNKYELLIWNNYTYTKFLFYLNYTLKYQEFLYYQYNSFLFVKDIPFMIYQQLLGFNKKIDKNIIGKIFAEKQILLMILNNFGLIVQILEDSDENIYQLIKPKIDIISNELIINHIGAYYFKYIQNIKCIKNVFSINFVEKEVMSQILQKQYKDYSQYINSPIIQINYVIKDYKIFEKTLLSLFKKNLRIDDINKYSLEIYLIDQNEIFDVNMNNIKLTRLNEIVFITKIMSIKDNFYGTIYKRFLISFGLK